MKITPHWMGVLGLIGPAYSQVAYAEVYMTEQQAVSSLFPGEKFERQHFELTDKEADLIHEQSHENVRSKTLVVWKSKNGNCVFVDQVLGKHEFITYAAGIKKDGTIQSIEILEYRESYGQQVRNEVWRKQFIGKGPAAVLKVNEDIKNISGATLSSVHISGGVRRLLQTYDAVKKRI